MSWAGGVNIQLSIVYQFHSIEILQLEPLPMPMSMLLAEEVAAVAAAVIVAAIVAVLEPISIFIVTRRSEQSFSINV